MHLPFAEDGVAAAADSGVRREDLGRAVIRTARGDIEIARLVVGDIVPTSEGRRRVVRVASRTIDCRRHPQPDLVRPIRVAAHAFAKDVPSRDILVSPDAAICVDILGEMLVDARALVNETSVEQIDVDEVVVWSVELDECDVVFAENLGLESSRGPDTAMSDPPNLDRPHDELEPEPNHCRPFYSRGPVIEAIRAQMRKRLGFIGWSLTDSVVVHLEIGDRRIEPVQGGLKARFHLPAGAEEAWLVSPRANPAETIGSVDDRVLGVCVTSLRIEDGLSAPRDIAIGDPLLGDGFHPVEDDCRRWTTGRARLPESLWSGFEHDFFLGVQIAGPTVPRWQRDTDASHSGFTPA